MMNFLIVASSLLLPFVAAQTCPPAGAQAPCSATQTCPVGQTCVDIGQITEECCDNASLPPTLPPTTVAGATTVAVTGTTIAGQTTVASGTTRAGTTSSTCADLLNPRTGISDCPMRASLCNDSVYYDVMTRQCPRTCNRCSSTSTTSSSTCADRLNPRTGISDCPARASLCNDSTYYDVMTRQCPRTCNRCTSTGTSSATTIASTGSTTASSTCVDQVNRATGVSDCPQRAYLCNNAIYRTLMTQQCPRTCGRCTSG